MFDSKGSFSLNQKNFQFTLTSCRYTTVSLFWLSAMCFHFTMNDIQGCWKYNQPLITIGDFTQDELQRRVIGQQCWNNDVTFRNTVATNLQRRVALKLSLPRIT